MQTGRTWNKQSYQRYLESDEWKARRAKRGKLAVWIGRRFVCEWCMTPQTLREYRPLKMYEVQRVNINIHHISYERIGNERFGDLMVLCRDCHQTLHEFIERLVAKGMKRKTVMEKLGPYCVRRIIATHQMYRQRSQHTQEPPE